MFSSNNDMHANNNHLHVSDDPPVDPEIPKPVLAEAWFLLH